MGVQAKPRWYKCIFSSETFLSKGGERALYDNHIQYIAIFVRNKYMSQIKKKMLVKKVDLADEKRFSG